MSGPGFPVRLLVKDKTVLSANPCELTMLRVINGDAGIRYLQLFDKATTGAVTLGTTVPIFTALLDASTTVDQPIDIGKGLRFSVGIVAAVTTGETTGALATLDSSVRFALR